MQVHLAAVEIPFLGRRFALAAIITADPLGSRRKRNIRNTRNIAAGSVDFIGVFPVAAIRNTCFPKRNIRNARNIFCP